MPRYIYYNVKSNRSESITAVNKDNFRAKVADRYGRNLDIADVWVKTESGMKFTGMHGLYYLPNGTFWAWYEPSKPKTGKGSRTDESRHRPFSPDTGRFLNMGGNRRFVAERSRSRKQNGYTAYRFGQEQVRNGEPLQWL